MPRLPLGWTLAGVCFQVPAHQYPGCFKAESQPLEVGFWMGLSHTQRHTPIEPGVSCLRSKPGVPGTEGPGGLPYIRTETASVERRGSRG